MPKGLHAVALNVERSKADPCLVFKAERITGNVSLVLEVEMYKAEVEEIG